MTNARVRGLIGALGAAALGSLLLLGVAIGDALILSAAVSLQVIAGGYLWRVATERIGEETSLDPILLFGMALALGTGGAAIAGALISLVRPTPWSWLAPSAVAIVVWLWRRLNGRRLRAATWHGRPSTAIGYLVALILGMVTIAVNVQRYPLAGSGPWTTFHQDMLYFEGLSSSTGMFGGTDSLFMSGADIRYHWFAYGWVGQVGQSLGTESFAALTRLLPIVSLLGCAALVVVWTARFVDRWPATVLAAMLLTAGGYLGARNGTILNFDSPSQNLTTLWLLGVLFMSITFVKYGGSWALVLVVAVLVAATSGGKISSAAIVIAPLLLVALVLTIRRDDQRGRAWIIGGVSLLIALATYLVFVAGSASGGDLEFFSLDSRASSIQGLDSSKGLRGVVLGTSALMLAMAARWWGLVWLVRDRKTRWTPETVLGVGLVVSGLVPVVLLSQGVNETWFALAASAPLSALSAAGIVKAWTPPVRQKAIWATLAFSGLVVVVVPLVWIPNVIYTTSTRFFGPWIGYGIAIVGAAVIAAFLGRQHRLLLLAVAATTILVTASSLGRVAPLISAIAHSDDVVMGEVLDVREVSIQESDQGSVTVLDVESDPSLMTETSWTSKTLEAVHFLRQNTGRHDIIVTNSVESFVMPALVARLTYISGAKYQSLYGSISSVQDIPERIQVSLEFVGIPSMQAFAELCTAGVTWGWISLRETNQRSWEPLATIQYANDEVAIIRLNSERCL